MSLTKESKKQPEDKNAKELCGLENQKLTFYKLRSCSQKYVNLAVELHTVEISKMILLVE